jgi:Uma2 family endonuclease
MTTTALTNSKPVQPRPLVYKESDGKPMAETETHRDVMIYLLNALMLHYTEQSDAGRPEVHVGGNNFVHYQEGNTRAYISPDVYVVFGVAQRTRDSYKVWEEGGHTPAVVFEITSKSTQGEDIGRKRRIYEQVLQVPEYFLFDPTGEYLQPRLRGYRLVEGQYVTLELESDRLHSDMLNLDLVLEGEMLRLSDPVTGRYLPTLLEEHQACEQEHQARLQAEAQVARECARAEQERTRAERLAARLRELGLTEEEV